MSFRENTQSGARRNALGITIGTLKKSDDARKMQEIDVDMLHDESRTGVEHFQPYPFFSNPLPPSSDGEPEVLIAHVGGSRSRPIALGVADRRHRKRNGQPGEGGFADDQGNEVSVRRGGPRVKAGDGKTVEIEAGNIKVTIKVGRIEIKIDDVMQFLIASPATDLQGCEKVQTVAGPAKAVFAKPE